MFGIGPWEAVIVGLLCCAGPLTVAAIVAVVVGTKKPPD